MPIITDLLVGEKNRMVVAKAAKCYDSMPSGKDYLSLGRMFFVIATGSAGAEGAIFERIRNQREDPS